MHLGVLLFHVHSQPWEEQQVREDDLHFANVKTEDWKGSVQSAGVTGGSTGQQAQDLSPCVTVLLATECPVTGVWEARLQGSLKRYHPISLLGLGAQISHDGHSKVLHM